MSAYDPRMKLKNLLGGVTATLDDDATPAKIMIVYTGSPENFKQWFYIYDYDVVITIDRPRMRESGARRRIQWDPLRYDSLLGVHISAVDKTGLTATKVLNKIRYSMEMVVEPVAASNTWTFIIQTSDPMNVEMGGYDPLWRDDYVFHFRPLIGSYGG